MTFLSTLTPQQMSVFLKIIQDSLCISRHKELFDWLHDDIQRFIPHDILLTAWGDFSLGLVRLDVVSYLAGVRTTEVEKEKLMPCLFELFKQWEELGRSPYTVPLTPTNDHLGFHHWNGDGEFGNALALMRSALVQGIKDERGRHDCLYVALSANRVIHEESVSALELLLPYLDAAMRQVAHLPVQYPDFPEIKSGPDRGPEDGPAEEGALWGLSHREAEIMRWVCMGKTNSEIAQILDISFFTVKNHLQRIFRKIDVLNRAQAVTKFKHLV